MNGQHPQHESQQRSVSTPPTVMKDPVCGMMVPTDAPLRTTFEGETYVFCNPRCRDRFTADPGKYVHKAPTAEPRTTPPTMPAARTEWTCPMHPQIVRDQPGSCPICGMALEPRSVSLEQEENPELRAMTRRFWVGVALSVPLMLIAMGHMIPLGAVHTLVASPFRPWLELGLATPVVLWGAWPFFTRAATSVVRRSLNMFTLIGLGVADRRADRGRRALSRVRALVDADDGGCRDGFQLGLGDRQRAPAAVGSPLVWQGLTRR